MTADGMRRLVAIAILLVLLLPFAAPAIGQTVAATPICCRLGGVHKCMMHTMESSGAPAVRAHCPMQTQPAAPGHATDWLIGVNTVDSAAMPVAAMKVRQAEAGFRISFHRSRQKRGPPAVRAS